MTETKARPKLISRYRTSEHFFEHQHLSLSTHHNYRVTAVLTLTARVIRNELGYVEFPTRKPQATTVLGARGTCINLVFAASVSVGLSAGLKQFPFLAARRLGRTQKSAKRGRGGVERN